jgi:hypothetical protein
MYRQEPPGSFGVDPAVAKFIADARAKASG